MSPLSTVVLGGFLLGGIQIILIKGGGNNNIKTHSNVEYFLTCVRFYWLLAHEDVAPI